MDKVYKKPILLVCLVIVLSMVLTAIILGSNIFGATTEITYNIQNDWGNGATVSVSIKNTDTTAINGWILSWTFPENQKINNMWNADYSQSASNVTVKSMAWNSVIPVNGSVSFGFNLSYSGTNNKPSNFTLNGSSSSETKSAITTGANTPTVDKTTSVPTPSPSTSIDGKGAAYKWPSYSPNIAYDFRDEYGNISAPTKVLDDVSGVAGTISSDWWTFKWGTKANSLVTEAAIRPMLARFEKDFAYFRDEMGWPPDLRARDGYKSAIYLYGSGLSTDNASNTEKGGWQSAVGKYPNVLASYYPVYCFDPGCTYSDKESQQSAMVHEGIHCILASMPGVKNAAWFHEGGNTWLQQEAYARQTGNYKEMGFLNGTSFLAPFMPIECYSGWLQDDSFGGPSAEGVNMYDGSQQICTWRTYLGGNQYGNAFPTFLGMTLGTESVAWIWRNCPTRVLEGMAKGLGENQLRRLITEYRAKQALIDMGKWSGAFATLLDNNFGRSIGAEWQPSWKNPEAWKATPYAKTTNSGGVLTPEQRTTPGWSGANQIPLKVTGNIVSVDFQPIGSNMTCQIAYRATDGTCVYSEPVSSGDCTLRLDKAPYNNVVIAVITNTDYVYNGETTRKAHYDYRLELGTGVSGTADIYTKWYNAPGVK